MWKVVILATIPVLVAGFFLHDVIETTLRSGKVVAWSFIVWGVVLYVSDRMAVLRKDTVEQVGIKRAMIIGFSQVLALIPGTSRSGITITAGLFSGLSRRTAATFSFLLAVPTIAAAGLLTLSDVFFGKNPSATSIGNLQLLVGFVTAFVTAFLTIKVFLTFLDKHSFAEIAVFRVVIGVLILLLI
jgi:undecaprenyl-diphosphatase